MLSDISDNKENLQQVKEKVESIKVAELDEVKAEIDKIFASEE